MLSDSGAVLLMILMACGAAGIITIAVLDVCGVKEDAGKSAPQIKRKRVETKQPDSILQKLRDMPVR